ncbi:hypothetical protein GCM10023149_50800 [Mucilaginibacter gynuensis]|uniref:Uncharacterized protein n=1 Tax=Mucilaginibacter gynuensis TaxID=1302236 RepID=A0ABP8HIL9_9SPHI
MNKIFISNHIKAEILYVCGLPISKPYNLRGQLTLSAIGYEKDRELCRRLELSLQNIAATYNTGRIITPGIVFEDLTVSECIRLVIAE